MEERLEILEKRYATLWRRHTLCLTVGFFLLALHLIGCQDQAEEGKSPSEIVLAGQDGTKMVMSPHGVIVLAANGTPTIRLSASTGRAELMMATGIEHFRLRIDDATAQMTFQQDSKERAELTVDALETRLEITDPSDRHELEFVADAEGTEIVNPSNVKPNQPNQPTKDD